MSRHWTDPPVRQSLLDEIELGERVAEEFLRQDPNCPVCGGINSSSCYRCRG